MKPADIKEGAQYVCGLAGLRSQVDAITQGDMVIHTMIYDGKPGGQHRTKLSVYAKWAKRRI